MPELAWTRRIRKKVATTRVMLPLYFDLGYARLTRGVFQATRGAGRKLMLTAAGSVSMAVLILLGHPLGATMLAPLVFGPAAVRLLAWGRRKGQVYAIARRVLTQPGEASARQTLRKLGLSDVVANELVARAAGGEVRIAAFDQENRVCSDVGTIPFFKGVEITPENFRKRNRHLLELVIIRDAVCVKKVYRDFLSFEIELLALDALSGVLGVPRVVAVQLRPHIVYQSFIVGRNLGSLMAPHGANDGVQDQVSVAFWGGDRWSDEPTSPARSASIAALSAAVPPDTIAGIGRLMDRIHESGVTITDVKYGNVLMVENEPHFCDFDRATVFRRNNWRCVLHRANDREMFNYFFGGERLTERRFRLTAERLAQQRPEIRARRIHFGHGYESPGGGSFEQGSAQWLGIRPSIPELAGRSILDLGGNQGLFSLEMLRAGARRVTTCEADHLIARYARLNHCWFEFVDNRSYPGFELMEGSVHRVCDRTWAGYDMATAFDGLDQARPEDTARLVQALSRDIECLIVRVNQSGAEPRSSLAVLRDILGSHGYPNQALVTPASDDRPLLIGRRSVS